MIRHLDFSFYSFSGKRLLLHNSYHRELCEILSSPERSLAPISGGRGKTYIFRFAGGSGVVRYCKRGGLLPRLSSEMYLLANRPLREFQIHGYLFEQGLDVPEPLGVLWERHGLSFSGAVVTRWIDAQDLRGFLLSHSGDSVSVLQRVGESIRRMHEAGVYHADLNVGNLLVGNDTVYIIDFDNARRIERLGNRLRFRNLLRLRRSLDKCGFPRAHFDVICRGYGVARIPRWLDAAYILKGFLSNLLMGRRRTALPAHDA